MINFEDKFFEKFEFTKEQTRKHLNNSQKGPSNCQPSRNHRCKIQLRLFGSSKSRDRSIELIPKAN